MLRERDVIYTIRGGEKYHTESHTRIKKKSQMVEKLKHQIALCGAQLKNTYGKFNQEELKKIASNKRRYEVQLANLETRCVSHKIKKTYKKLSPEKIREYVLKEIELSQKSGRDWIFAEDIAIALQVKTHAVKQVLQQLNVEGILNQPTHKAPHDSSRDPWGFAGNSGWMGDIYYIRHKDEESESV